MSHGERRTPGRPATAAAGLPRHRAGPGGWARARRVRGLCNTSNNKDYKIKILSPPKTTTKTQIPSQSAVASAGRTAHTQRLRSLRTNLPQGEPVPFPLHRSSRSPASPSLGNDFISSDYSSDKAPNSSDFSVFLCSALCGPVGHPAAENLLLKGLVRRRCAARWVLWFLSRVCKRLTAAPCAVPRKHRRRTKCTAAPLEHLRS